MSETPTQRFNHVAMSVPEALLDPAGIVALLAFYQDVFGWTEMPTLTEPGRQLVLRAHSNEQFVFLVAEGAAMRAGARDHFGLSVAEPAELDQLYERACKYRERDPQVEIEARKTDDFTVVKLHSFYVRYRIPLWVEVQCYEWAAGFDAASTG